ncbi:MAG: hypothetical protein JNM64_12975, partial [Chloroflexia bacterium]|nr:hypothetical protein [Chloroflexia bacterium]
MTMTTGRNKLMGLALLAGLLLVGCDTGASSYRPPAAAVNGPSQSPAATETSSARAANEETSQADSAPAETNADSAERADVAAADAPVAEAPAAKTPVATASRPLEGAKKAHATPEARAEAERKAAERGLDQGGPFDPIKENGQYFVGWKKPKLALVISGRQDGYIEPCGCAGLEKQLGGLSRRMAFFQDLKKRGWSVAAVDVGGVVRR